MGVSANRYSLGVNENILNEIMGMTAQPRKYAKPRWSVHFTRVNFGVPIVA